MPLWTWTVPNSNRSRDNVGCVETKRRFCDIVTALNCGCFGGSHSSLSGRIHICEPSGAAVGYMNVMGIRSAAPEAAQKCVVFKKDRPCDPISGDYVRSYLRPVSHRVFLQEVAFNCSPIFLIEESLIFSECDVARVCRREISHSPES